ncbi:MAG TPA: hypothetical protein VGG74_06585 [Kofleriaceae bacterium]
METTDITVQILRDIRDDLRGVSSRLDRFEQRVDARFDAIDRRFDAVDARFDRLELRVDLVDSRLVGMEQGISDLRRDFTRPSPIGDGDALVKRVSRCERDIAELKQRLDDPRR